MIDKDSLICIGYISRPHSFKGELQLTLERKVVPLQRGDFLFFKIEGHFIPFKIESLKGKESEPVIKFHFVDTYEYAQELCSSEVYSLMEVLPEESEFTFIGYEVVDNELGSIGLVEDVQELPQQIMILVRHQEEIKYIPLVEEFIDYIEKDKKEIWVDLPEGLLDL